MTDCEISACQTSAFQLDGEDLFTAAKTTTATKWQEL